MPADSVRVATHDGDELDVHLAVPERGAGPGIVLLHEALAVTDYTRGVELLAERIDEVTCPALLHFGTDDVFITPDALQRLQLAAAAKPNIEIEVYEGAGHAFDNPHADWHDRDAATRAWDRTASFLAANLASS